METETSGILKDFDRRSAVKRIRIIPRLDVKGPNVVKGIRMEGLRIVGNPRELAKRYYEDGADELLYIDIVASLYGRDNLVEIVRQASEDIFIPMTVGGGVRSLDDINTLLRAGADKVAINTAAIKRPQLIAEAARTFGSQCIVVSIEAKTVGDMKWEAYVDNGREKTGEDAVQWAKQAEGLGAGEILVTSVDREGTFQGYDTDLIFSIASSVSVPIIACGGAGRVEHITDCIERGGAGAVALASLLHYNKLTISGIKKGLALSNFKVRA